MSVKRVKHSSKFKTKIALEVLKGNATLSEISSKHSLHPTQVVRWKKQVERGIEEVFNSKGTDSALKKAQEKESELFEEIGRLKFELDWLKKKCQIYLT